MKKPTWILILLAVILTVTFAGCGNGNDAEDGMQKNEIAPLTESQVSNLLFVLPDILDFAENYQARLTQPEKDSPDANEKYFKALKESTKISNAVALHQFRNTDEMMEVYKNVLLEYTTVKKNLTNGAMIDDLRKTIGEYRSNYNAILNKNDLTKDEETRTKKLLSDLKMDEIRYENILIVKKFEKDLDRISQSQEH